MNELQGASRPPAPRVLFLGGLGRSGTTLLERILGGLPGAVPVGEVVHLWKRGVVADELCGCGEHFGCCPFWQAVGRQAFGGWDQVDVERVEQLRARVDRTRRIPVLMSSRLRRGTAAAVVEYSNVYRRVYEAAAAVAGGQVVIDSSKHASLAFCLSRAAGIDLRVVHVVRDSRAVAYSWTREVRRPEADNTDPGMTRYTPSTTAALWNGHNIAFDLLRLRGARVLLLRYEDLVADPTTSIRAVATFAGLEFPGAQATDLAQGSVYLDGSHTVAGNPMRFSTGWVRIRPDDAWRTHLGTSDRRRVTALTAPMLARYGYLR